MNKLYLLALGISLIALVVSLHGLNNYFQNNKQVEPLSSGRVNFYFNEEGDVGIGSPEEYKEINDGTWKKKLDLLRGREE